jgi:hypothetical protein
VSAVDNGVAWFLASAEGLTMKQINTYALYQLANELAPLRSVPSDASELTKANVFPMFLANYYIEQFFTEQRLMPLELSGDAAAELSTALQNVGSKVWADPPQKVEEWELRAIRTKLTDLETVMALELQRHQTYLVSQIGGYSMPLLATKAEVNLLEDALAVIGDQAKKDFREAGRCLAFELPTAAGFHAMRATENVLRQYYMELTGKTVDRIEWGPCIQELRSANANQKVLQVLDQIRDLHRNPLMHPQDFLSMKEAIGLFDIAKSAIGAIAEEVAILQKAAAASPAQITSVSTTAMLLGAAQSPSTGKP